MGTMLGGWSFHVLDGRLRYAHNYVGKVCGRRERRGRRARPINFAMSFFTAGDFKRPRRCSSTAGSWEGAHRAASRPPHVRHSITGGGITCGWEQGTIRRGPGYTAPFPFTGTLHRVVVDVSGEPYRDPEAEFEAIMSEQ